VSTFLDDYGAAETRRLKTVKRIAGALLVVVLAAGALYFAFRNYREKGQASTFLNLLRERQYEKAYEAWGCTAAKPCPDYAYEKFLEDWGPESPHTNLSSMQVVRTNSCADGIIQILRFGDDEEVRLWVSRSDLSLSFAPWPVCNPRLASPGM
jgi:hypothetical protein